MASQMDEHTNACMCKGQSLQRTWSASHTDTNTQDQNITYAAAAATIAAYKSNKNMLLCATFTTHLCLNKSYEACETILTGGCPTPMRPCNE